MNTQYKSNRTSLYGNFDPEEERALDILVEYGNFSSRTELVTTSLRQLIHKGDADAPEYIKKALKDELHANKLIDSIREELYKILDECATYVLVNHGAEAGYHKLSHHLKEELYKRAGKVPEDKTLNSWTKRYYDLHHAEFEMLKLDNSTRKFEESCGFDAVHH